MVRAACLVCALLPGVAAHFQLVNAAITGPKYSSLDTALPAEKIDRSQSLNFVGTCENPYLWVKFSRPAGFNTLMVGGTVPVIERFWDVRVAVAVIGYGLPQSGLQEVPQKIRDQVPAGMGVHAVPAVPDQSTCSSFTDDPLSTGQMHGGPEFAPYQPSMGSAGDAPFTGFHNWPGPRCFFHEEWGGADMWVVQDELVPLSGDGEHYIVFWAPSDKVLGEPLHTAKFGAVFGDVGQSEEFSGTTVDAGECALPAPDFYENECKNGFGHHPAVHGGGAPPAGWGDRRKLMHNWPECRPFIGIPIPNRYECSSAPSTMTDCASICHNHGATCPPGGSKCGTASQAKECAETCSWQTCGTDGVTKAGSFAQGLAGIGCPDHCMMTRAAPAPTTCRDLKVAYKYFKCCADSLDKPADFPIGTCSADTEKATCLDLKTAYQSAECCDATNDKVVNLPASSCALSSQAVDLSDCPLECLGDFSAHHDEEEGGDAGGCTNPLCQGASPPSFCAFLPGCGGGGGAEASPSPSAQP